MVVFDIDAELQHPIYVLTFGSRLATVAAVVALSGGNLALCAGWPATPEARMVCCADATCPMHKSDARDSGSTRTVSQAQADSCCAASERNASATPGSPFVLSGTLTLAPSPVPAILPTFTSDFNGWRARVPAPGTPVPKHLLLSVLIV